MEADYYFFRSSYQFAPVYFIWGCDLFCSRIVSICHAGTNDLSIKAFLWPICSLETVINGDKQNWKSTYYLHGKTGNSLCHFNWELQKIWAMFSFGDAMFLVFSSLHRLIWIYLVAGPFLTMLNLLLYVFVRDIQPDSLRTGKHSYLGTSLSPRILVGCFH